MLNVFLKKVKLLFESKANVFRNLSSVITFSHLKFCKKKVAINYYHLANKKIYLNIFSKILFSIF